MIGPPIVFQVLTHGKNPKTFSQTIFKNLKISTLKKFSFFNSFNQLDLPAYETYDKLCTYLRKAIHECSEGFGFA